MTRSATRRLVTVIAVVGVLGTTACSSGADGGESAAAPSGTVASGSPGPGDDGSSDAPASRPPDPVVTDVPAVKRPDGAPAKKRVRAEPVSFSTPLRYSDGVEVTVSKIVQGETSGSGPGVFDGAPFTQLTLTVANGGDAPLDLSAVVVTTTYGKPARLAQPVYDEDARDLSGTLAPGDDATGVYQFSVPTDQLDEVTTIVDLDGRHAPGKLSGSVG